ncbi:MAG: hypothetical protein Q9163_003776 [Psora crenata]
MASKSTLGYAERARKHPNRLAKKLFETAEAKKSNIVISADLTNTNDLLALADELGPYIAGFKTHIDIVSDFSAATVEGLKSLAEKHNFFIFEDRKFVDIGNTVQMQYDGGALRISEWAHVVNASVLAGEGIVEAMAQTGTSKNFAYKGDRGLLLLAEMTTKGSLATGDYTKACIHAARKHSDFVIGFVATQALTSIPSDTEASDSEDFVVFTTGVNRATKGDPLGQQYQTPEAAIGRGADFIISGRGIYGASNPVEAAKLYQKDGWDAYLARI